MRAVHQVLQGMIIITGGIDGFVNYHPGFSREEVEGVRWKDFVGADNRYREDGKLEVDRHFKGALFERSERSVPASRAFRKKKNRSAVHDFFFRRVQRGQCAFMVGTVDENMADLFASDSDAGYFSQFLLHYPFKINSQPTI